MFCHHVRLSQNQRTGLRESALEILARPPSELAFDLAGIHGVAKIVAGPIGDEADQVATRAGRARRDHIDQIADALHHTEIGAFAARANVVSLADPAVLERQCQRLRVVSDMEPVADIAAIAIDRQRLVRQSANDRVRDQLLRKMIRPVIVRAAGYQGGKSVGFPPGANEMIGRGLARRIGRVRRIGGLFAERTAGAERSENFVGRDWRKRKRARFSGVSIRQWRSAS